MAMAERDISPRNIERVLKGFSIAEIVGGVIMALSPIGAPGIVLILVGGIQFALIERQKNKKE